jgi:hypothetical protein
LYINPEIANIEQYLAASITNSFFFVRRKNKTKNALAWNFLSVVKKNNTNGRRALKDTF